MTSQEQNLAVILAHIISGVDVLRRIENHLASFLEQDENARNKTTTGAIVIADALSRYYTAAETIFFRIARFFENNIDGERWHAELLDRMAMAIPGVRPAVISDNTRAAMRELMRFRHFSRYYVELEYDWQRLDFLLLKYAVVKDALECELIRFHDLLKAAETTREN